jgi:hypothetical protein
MEELVDGLMEACGNELVSLQHKQKLNEGSSTEIYEVTLQESIDYMMDSNHHDAYFAFCEGLLSTVKESAPRDGIDKLSKSFIEYVTNHSPIKRIGLISSHQI